MSDAGGLPVRRTLAWLPWGLAAALAPLLSLLRLRAHPDHYWDGEGSIPATIAREVSHGHWLDIFEYQLITYQGSLVLDPLIAAPAFALLGDGLLSWHWLGLTYLLALASLGAWLLARDVSRFSAALWLALLAVAPFALKDPFVVIIGGHASGLVWGLAALAALRSGRGGLGGALWAVGAWYVRTTLLLWPALLLGCRSRSQAGRFVAGCAVLPLLLVGNAWQLSRDGPGEPAEAFVSALRSTWVSPGGQRERRALPRKLAEATGWELRETLYGQPRPLDDAPKPAPGATEAGLAWAGLLVGAPFLALLALRRRAAWPLVAASCSYFLAYLATPLAIEDNARLLGPEGAPLAPSLNAIRYLGPVWPGLLLAAAAGAGSARGRGRWAVCAAALPWLGLGAWATADDLLHHAEAPEVFETAVPTWHGQLVEPHRGPRLETHAACLTRDPESISEHLHGVAMHLARSPEALRERPARQLDALLRLERERPWSDRERRLLATWLGHALAARCPEPADGCALALVGAAASLAQGSVEPGRGAWSPRAQPELRGRYVAGFISAQAQRGQWVDRICAASPPDCPSAESALP